MKCKTILQITVHLPKAFLCYYTLHIVKYFSYYWLTEWSRVL